ncbi:MAG: DUF554 domain-containing protein [Sphaerochaetaceae bacterium]|nr:DUF554 domain-containing protein [Sphaerochaetaceae bacterium]
MIGVVINCLAVILGTLLGLFAGRNLKEDFKTVVFSCSGLVTVVMGIQMALESENMLILLIALLLGGFCGYLLKIEDRVLSLGSRLEKTFSKKEGNSSDFARGFMNASVLFCSGSMSVVGSIQAGTTGELQTILIKSVMDGCMAIVFSSVYGVGVAFSALSILVYQGFFTLAGSYIGPVLGDSGITALSAAGGILLIMIGLGLLKIKEFKNANYLPALLFAPLLTAAVSALF